MTDPAPRRRFSASVRSYADLEFDAFRRTKDPDALARVFDATARPLHHLARTIARDAAAADDLVQTTFVAAIDAAGAYDPRHPLMPWLIGILHNRARRHRRVEGRVPDSERLPRERPLPDPRECAAADELRQRVRIEIAGLPPCYRPVVDMHVRLGMTPLEIARALRRPRSTVRTQLSRGLTKLRDSLQPLLSEVG